MTLAVELADSGLRVAVLESGRQKTTAAADALRALSSEGIAIKEWSRERVLGGTSTTWAGLSSPLDPVDFSPRPFLRLPGWPIARETLRPYWERAARRYRFAPPRMYGSQGFGALKTRGDASLAWRELEEKIFLACSEPQDFGREHRAAVEGEAVDLWLDATVLRLERGEPGEGAGAGGDAAVAGGAPRVTRAVLACAGGRQGEVSARVFVLAAGGIENARLLLASRDLCAGGLGNERDQVGRGLMNHPKNYHGTIRLAQPVVELPYHFGCLYHGYAGYAGLRLGEARQAELECLNSYVRFEPLFPWSGNRGVEAFVLLAKRSKGLLRRWKERQADEVVAMRDYSETGDDSELQNERKSLLGWIGIGTLVLLNAVVVARYLASRLLEGRAPVIHKVRLRNFMEMEPHPDNRVLLGERTDALGQRLPIVRHQSTALDRRSLVALHAALAQDLAANGFGTLESGLSALAEGERWPIDQDASHHMGGTRMGRDPATSVVDPNCRLHGVGNVYVAGASVFPTSGCANPTFTLVALAIRLADHLRVDVFGRPPSPEAFAAAPAEPAVAARSVPTASKYP
ncbi:MAG TPA: GMC oxidoreductase, partial [Planctomycetota bacterium]|nr:GMC oxidoreductase [Planctomycetota bacterium]